MQKTAQKNNFNQNTQINRTYQNRLQADRIQPQNPAIDSNLHNEPSTSKKNKFGFFPKLLLLSAAITGAVWNIPALNKALIKKEKNLPRLERRFNRKIRLIKNKGEGVVSIKKRSVEKKLKHIGFEKKIFEKINQTPVLKKARDKFSYLANYIESKIQKPFKTFMQKHVFGFIKK